MKSEQAKFYAGVAVIIAVGCMVLSCGTAPVDPNGQNSLRDWRESQKHKAEAIEDSMNAAAAKVYAK